MTWNWTRGALLDYAEQARRAAGTHVTVTHLVGRAVAHGLTAVPELRVRLACGRERAGTGGNPQG